MRTNRALSLVLVAAAAACGSSSSGSGDSGGAGGAGSGSGGRGGSAGRGGSGGGATGGAVAGGQGGASGQVGSGGGGGTAGAPGTGGSTGGSGGGDAQGGGGGSGGGDAHGGGGGSGAGDGPAGEVTPPSPAACAKFVKTAGAVSQWVYVDQSGRLAYKPLNAQGDGIMDFSHAGYRGGGVPLPRVPVVKMVEPSGGADDAPAIQAALNEVAALVPRDGFRGAVLLRPGTFKVGATLNINTSGVVLRGSGSGTGGTVVQLTGAPHDLLSMRGTGTWAVSAETIITDGYVPSGATSFTVADASGLKVGDPILIRRPVTAAWISFMGMDTLVRNGQPQTWLTTTTRLPADRTITAITGNRITVDVPLADSYDSKYLNPPGTTVGKYSFAGRISEVGLEAMRVTAPVITAPISQPLFGLLQANAVIDGWVSDVVALETENSLLLDQNVKRFTIQDLSIQRSLIADSSAGYPLEVQFNGSQILVLRGSIKGDNLYTYCTGARSSGPNAILHATATGVHTRLEPHARWSVGFLADNVTHDDQLNLVNRGTAGSGHGWTIGWGVLWNSGAASLNVQKPPGSMNWAIGSKGRQVGDGTFDSLGTPVSPSSLYLAQLCERLGPDAVAAIGYR